MGLPEILPLANSAEYGRICPKRPHPPPRSGLFRSPPAPPVENPRREEPSVIRLHMVSGADASARCSRTAARIAKGPGQPRRRCVSRATLRRRDIWRPALAPCFARRLLPFARSIGSRRRAFRYLAKMLRRGFLSADGTRRGFDVGGNWRFCCSHGISIRAKSMPDRADSAAPLIWVSLAESNHEHHSAAVRWMRAALGD